MCGEQLSMVEEQAYANREKSELRNRIKRLEALIIEVDSWVKAGEGVNLAYYGIDFASEEDLTLLNSILDCNHNQESKS